MVFQQVLRNLPRQGYMRGEFFSFQRSAMKALIAIAIAIVFVIDTDTDTDTDTDLDF